MSALRSLGWIQLEVLLVLALVGLAAQCLHVFAVGCLRAPGRRWLALAAEALVAASIASLAMVFNGLLHGWEPMSAGLGNPDVSAVSLLWVNAPALGCCVARAVAERRWGLLADVVPLTLTLPPVLTALGGATAPVLVGCAAYLAFRTTYALGSDARRRRTVVSPIGAVDAIKRLPEAVLCGDADGRAVLVNDAMRGLAAEQGLSADLGDARGLRSALLSARRTGEPGHALLRTGDGRVWDLREDEVRLGPDACWRLLGVDVTEEKALHDSLKAAAESLARENERLGRGLAETQRLAEQEALLQVRCRVHDVIGQRLSILHRCLEDAASEEDLGPALALIASIQEDLTSSVSDPLTQFEATVDAFRLAGVDVRVTGALPGEPSVARAMADIAREALTNAVGHAHAREVSVSFVQTPSVAAMTVSNATNPHRPPVALPVEEGTGILSMRRGAALAGGRVEVSAQVGFEVRAVFPWATVEGSDGAARSSQKEQP